MLAQLEGDGVERQVILVVDDDPSVLALVATIATRGGYEVLTAASGREALQITAERYVDLLVTDLAMPGMDGSELIQRIKSLGTISRFLVLSGWADAVRGLGAPSLAKPFSPDELLHKIRDVIAS